MRSSVVACRKSRPKAGLEQDIQTAATSHRSHNTCTDTTCTTAARAPAVIGIVTLLLLLRGVALLLRRVIHRLLALGVISLLALLGLAIAWMGWVEALLLGLAAAIVVVCGAGALALLLVVGACVVGLGRVGGRWACLKEINLLIFGVCD